MRCVRSLFRLLLLGIVLAILAFVLVRSKYHEVIHTLAETQVKNVTSDLINDAIDKVNFKLEKNLNSKKAIYSE